MEKKAVIGVGNLLLRDEGIGIHVIQEMRKMGVKNIDLLDCATAGLDLLHIIGKYEKIVIVDAVKGGNKPGTIYKLGIRDINFEKGEALSLHEVNLTKTLEIGEKLGLLPEKIVLIGVEPKDLGFGMELSEEVKKSLPFVIDTTLKEIKGGN